MRAQALERVAPVGFELPAGPAIAPANADDSPEQSQRIDDVHGRAS
jgi:hypothetical protein